MITKDTLAKLHTRVLLKALRLSCASEQQLWKINEDRAAIGLPALEAFASKERYYQQAFVEPRALGLEEGTRIDVTIAELKAELATRPHVPNKQESKAIRKAKALDNRNRGRRDR
jgi:hypothetical protein